MNILSIGNSFSENAHRYLHKIARADEKQNLLTWNLYIGGCPLITHYRNMLLEAKAYSLNVNGDQIGLKISMKDALLAMDWDYISVQQASAKSYDYNSYQPYISEIVSYARELCPKAKILIHQTWAYEQGSQMLASRGYVNHTDMFRDIAGCYDKAAKETNADAIIPSGYTMQALLKMGIPSVHADSFHANDIAKFAIAATWYQALMQRSIKNIDFTHFDFDSPHTTEEIDIAKRASYESAKKYGFEIKAI